MFFTNFGNAINFRGIWDKIAWHGEKAKNPRPKAYHKYAKKLNILELLYPDLYEDEQQEEEPVEPEPENPDQPVEPEPVNPEPEPEPEPQEPENPEEPVEPEQP